MLHGRYIAINIVRKYSFNFNVQILKVDFLKYNISSNGYFLWFHGQKKCMSQYSYFSEVNAKE